MEVQILSHAPGLFLLLLGRQSVRSRNLHTARSRSFGSCAERLRRLMIGRLPVEEYGASLNLVVAASFAGVRKADLADALSTH